MEDSIITFEKQQTFYETFGLVLNAGERIKSAFNHVKVKCLSNSDTQCIKTTLVVDTTLENDTEEAKEPRYFEVFWKKKVSLVFCYLAVLFD